jgi:hypothetical protein
VLRYRFRARDRAGGTVLEPFLIGRVFPNRSACARYMDVKLAPVAARMRDRPEVAAFAAPAAMIDALNMVVHVWPVDAELPTLVDVTDRRHMLDVFGETLPAALNRPFAAEDCRIELVSHRRRRRCVLRYTLFGRTPDRDEVGRLIVYGKVTGFGDQALNSRTLEAVRERIRGPAAVQRFRLPRSFGSRPELGLLLLEALPGEAEIGPALRARVRGEPAPAGPPLEDMVTRCAHVAAMLHASGVELGPRRTVADEIDGLQREVAMAREFAPTFGARARSVLERIAAVAEQSEPLTLHLGHGDFKHEQLLFDGAASGLVDFDAIGQAEPALDLGKFLAHLRSEVRKLQMRASVSSALGDDLAERFLGAYVAAGGKDERQLRLRTTLYEAIALLRLAVRSQLDLDETRADLTAAVLEERMSALADQYATRDRT